MGGLGNQMFQYAFARNLSLKNNTNLKADLAFLLDRTPRENFVFRDYDLDIFNLRLDAASEHDFKLFNYQPTSLVDKIYYKTIRTIVSPQKIVEQQFNFNHTNKITSKNIYLEGYWQTEKYFEENEKIIRNDFTFKNPLSDGENELNKIIQSSTSVCVNFRRTDFVTLPNTSQTHGVPSMDYYHFAIKIISEKVNNPHFFVFSDDMEWCINNFKIEYPVTYVTHEFKGNKFSSYLQLMKNCKHFIIPNSTFAWWAAWLSDNPGKNIVAPKQWFADKKLQNQSQDISPSSWIRI